MIINQINIEYRLTIVDLWSWKETGWVNYELWNALTPDMLRYRTGILMQKKLRRMELEIFFIQINQIFTIYYWIRSKNSLI